MALLQIYILDGKSGDVLWYKDSPGAYDYTVSPPLTLSTSMSFRDAFIFRISSTNVPFKTLTNHSVSTMVSDCQFLCK